MVLLSVVAGVLGLCRSLQYKKSHEKYNPTNYLKKDFPSNEEFLSSISFTT